LALGCDAAMLSSSMFDEDAYPELEGVGEAEGVADTFSRAAVRGAGRSLGKLFDVIAVRGTVISTVFAVGAMFNWFGAK